jgi:hypothetical protein
MDQTKQREPTAPRTFAAGQYLQGNDAIFVRSPRRDQFAGNGCGLQHRGFVGIERIRLPSLHRVPAPQSRQQHCFDNRAIVRRREGRGGWGNTTDAYM